MSDKNNNPVNPVNSVNPFSRMKCDSLLGCGILNRITKKDRNNFVYYSIHIDKLGSTLEMNISDQQYNEINASMQGSSPHFMSGVTMIEYTASMSVRNEADTWKANDGRSGTMIKGTFTTPVLINYKEI